MRNKLLITIMISLLIIVIGIAYAGERRTIPPDPFGPIYGDWFANDEWAVFIFYRPPDCVSDDFNFFDYIDFRALTCTPITVEGFTIYENPGDMLPKQAEFYGLGAVPVWFIPREDYNSIASDGVLTMGELDAISHLEGLAHFYEETMHTTGAHPTPMKNFVARGSLMTGASFQVHGLVVIQPGDIPHWNVKITFK
jgi:hypothetical protein